MQAARRQHQQWLLRGHCHLGQQRLRDGRGTIACFNSDGAMPAGGGVEEALKRRQTAGIDAASVQARAPS
jgi:hypothetical protein